MRIHVKKRNCRDNSGVSNNMLLMLPRSQVTGLLRRAHVVSTTQRIPLSRPPSVAVRFAVETPHRGQQAQLSQWRCLSTSSSDQNDQNQSNHPKQKDKITPTRLRKKIRADVARAKELRMKIKAEVERDVERAKELVIADVERAKDLALHQIVNVPNMITFARIVATPYLGFLIWEGSYTSAVGVLAVAGLSDWLDGFLARKLKQESIIGSFLDPFADKLMIGTLSLSMLSTGLLPWPLVGLVFGRDVLLIAGTFYYRLNTKAVDSAFFDTNDSGAFQVAPSMLSKVNTALQFAMFGFALTNAAWQMPGDPALDVLFGVVGTTTFLSGSEYLWSYINKTGAFRPLPTPTPTSTTTPTSPAVESVETKEKRQP